jgi:hypothetical protein
MFALSLSSMVTLAPTFDEQGFIVRGLAYVRGENRHMRVGHPLGLNALTTLLLANDPQVKLPTDDPSWQEISFHRPAELFLWEIGNDVAHVIFLARLPTIWLAMLLAAVTGRWAWQLSRQKWAGLLALILIALDPNILAHGQLATTDLGLALGATIAGWGIWRYWTRPSTIHALLAGISFGLLQNTKFTAGLFVPLFGLVVVMGVAAQWHGGRRQDSRRQDSRRTHHQFPWRALLRFCLLFPTAAFFTLWAGYGFQIGTLPTDLPTLTQLAGLTIPLSHHIEQLADIGGRLQVETAAFLMGQYSSHGWWYYFPVAFLLKTPLPTLVLLGTAVSLRLVYYLAEARRSITDHASRLTPHAAHFPLFNDAALLIPPLGYFAIALTSEINLGYRHLLPILPFTAVFIAYAFAEFRSPPSADGLPITHYRLRFTDNVLRFTFYATFALLTLIALWIYPHYLSYFNLLAGGPDNGWRYLVDSNLDWGQDLNKLQTWMDENDVSEVWLSYFGEARPAYYGIAYKGLDSWPPRLMNPAARPYYPLDPAPGIYAISATNLQGVHFANHDQFAWFREREPIAKIGYSLFLYEVPATGGPVDVVLAGRQLDEVLPSDFAQFNSNDLALHWVDPAAALIIPNAAGRWLVLAKETAVSPTITALIQSWPVRAERDHYTIYQIPPLAIPEIEPLALYRHDSGEIGLMSAVMATAVTTDTLQINTAWQQKGPQQPVKIFIHLLNEQGELVAQWDGLGAEWAGWRPGDALLHTHTIPLPHDLPPGSYTVQMGLYQPATGQRWLTETGTDHFILGELSWGDSVRP